MPKLRSQEDIEHGLAALVLHDGSERRAERFLAEQGIRIPNETLRDWKTIHADRLAELYEEHLPIVRARFRQRLAALYGRQIALKEKLVAKVDDEYDQLTTFEAAKALQPISISAGVDVDKHFRFHDEPAELRDHHDLDALWRMLTGRETEEITDATVVEDEPTNGQAPRAEARQQRRELVAGD